MGQQPNVPLTIGDLPRSTGHPGAARRWTPGRPGELHGPADLPTGSGFGAPGPDAGYALRLLRGMELPGGDRLRADVLAAVAAVMTARSGALGRAPVAADARVAIEVLRLGDDPRRLAGVAHDHARLRALVAAIPADVLIGEVR